jgi:hypothetical protein
VRRILLAFVLALAAIPAGRAADCPRSSVKDKLDGAEIAFVGTVRAVTPVGSSGGIALADYRFDVLHGVKGDVGKHVTLRAAKLVDIDQQEVTAGSKAEIGVLASRENGRLVTSSCSLVDPVTLLDASDTPKGGAIKVVIGLVIAGLVVLYSLRRLRRRRSELGSAS